MSPEVSIVILNYFHPEVINICLRTLEPTVGDFEVVVVDNGSDDETRRQLEEHKAEGRIDTLILNPINSFFSEGNNIGVRNTNSESKYILLLNSDVGFLRNDWLQKQIAWMEGTAEYRPSIWGLKPTVVRPGPLDVVSIGYSHDINVQPSRVRPEGWCCMFRRQWWRDMSPDFPYYYGFEEMIATIARQGARVGVLSQYGPFLTHREQGSQADPTLIHNNRQPDIGTWFSGLDIETLDFTLGPDEHSSYLDWT